MASEIRDKAILCGCPKCGSPPHFKCEGVRGVRSRFHIERIAEARRGNIVAAPRRPDRSPEFYASDEWRRVRYKALLRSRGVCECCGSAPTKRRPLHVDHIMPRSRFPELSLVLDNLQVLCADCNLGKGAWDCTDWRSPNVAGDPQ